MYKGFLGETKIIKIRLPIDTVQRIEVYAKQGSSINSILRTLITMGLNEASKMPLTDFMKLVLDYKNQLKKENSK